MVISTVAPDNVIHEARRSSIFSQRFASIMILSPSFLVRFLILRLMGSCLTMSQEFMPHFAERYSFQYELVTYKWPAS